MKTFYLYGDMADNFCKKISLDIDTIREFFDSLSCNFPAFRKYLINKTNKGIQYTFIDENKDLLEHYCYDLPLSSKTYHVMPIIEGAAGFGELAGNFLAQGMMGYAMQSLVNDTKMVEDDGTPEYEKITTNSFIYNDNENTIDQGSPIPVVYGQLRVGSKVINSTIHNYDYNYDDAEIYEIKPSYKGFKITNPNKILDLRSDTDEFFTGPKSSQEDPSKRKTFETSFVNRNSEKGFNQDAENSTANYLSSSKNSELKIVGPSENPSKPLRASASASWWDHDDSTAVRPTLWGNGIDKNMRPASKNEACVETIAENNSETSIVHSFESKSQNLTVGQRGSYQKLESISIYQTLEVLSEGPIVGLANPIVDFESDNGLGCYPYIEDPDSAFTSIASSSSKIKLEPLRFNPAQNKITNANGGSSVKILSKGKYYEDTDGTIEIESNNIDEPLYMSLSVPQTMNAADIGPIAFGDEDRKNDDKIISSSNLFAFDPSDGALTLNTFTDASLYQYPLIEKYIKEEQVSYNGESVTTHVVNLEALSQDSDNLSYGFQVGKGYPADDTEYSFSPEVSDPEITFNYADSTDASRQCQATVFDASVILDDPDFPSETTQFIKSKLSASTSSRFVNTIDWNKLPRIYYDGNELDETNLPNNVTHDTYLYVRIGTITLKQQDNRGGSSSSSVTLHLRLSIGNYIGLGQWSRNDIGYWNGSTFYKYYSDLKQTSTIKSLGNFSENWQRTYTYSSSWSRDSAIRDDDYRLLSDFEKKDSSVVNYFSAAKFSNYLNGQLSDSVSIAPYINASAELSKRFADTAKNEIPNLKTIEFNKRHFIKFGVGSGSSEKPSVLLNNIPKYMLTKDCDNFDDIFINYDGGIQYFDVDSASETPITDDKGFYNPLIFPRVTIFVIRTVYNEDPESFVLLPTIIDAVASIDALGKVESVLLLKVPDNPVYSPNDDLFYPIYPFDNTPIFGTKFFKDSAGDSASSFSKPQNFTDHGIILSIDPSSHETMANFRIENGKVEFKADPNKEPHLNSNIKTNFLEHIRQNQPTYSDPLTSTGLYPFAKTIANFNNSGMILKKTIEINDRNSTYSNTKSAYIELNLENINLDNTYKINNIVNKIALAQWSTICTGRPNSIILSNPGEGFVGKNGESVNGKQFSFSLFPYERIVSDITIKNRGFGFRPNSSFYIYGMDTLPNTVFASGQPVLFCSNVSFKAKVTTNDEGVLEYIQIIDPGYNMISQNMILSDKLTTTQQDLLFTKSIVPKVSSQNVGLIDPSSQLDPSKHFYKRPLTIRASRSFINQPNAYGSITKFYVHQHGMGFHKSLDIDSIFSTPEIQKIKFNVNIQDGSLVSMSLADSEHDGYSELDDNIKIKVASPNIPKPTSDNSTTPASEDPQAWARSIYLNDTPIRDRLDRFNYSKFHFDMRIGHWKNGNKDKAISDSKIIATAKNPIIQEFAKPSNTNIINYPLYGPRNNGEMDYYYTHTIRNSNVSDVLVSIKINELHYIYEGDESNLYVNLSPAIMIPCVFSIAEMITSNIIDIAASTLTKGGGGGGGGGAAKVIPCTGTGVAKVKVGVKVAVKDLAPKLKKAAFIALKAILMATLISLIGSIIRKWTISCSKLPFLCFKVGEIVKNSGEIWPAMVYINIEYGLEGEGLKKETIAFRGCATNPYIKDIPITDLPNAHESNNFKNRIVKVYRITREADPVRQGIVEARYKIKAELHSVTECISHSLSFPNTAVIGTRINSKDHPTIPKREYVIKGRIIKVPVNYSPLSGAGYSDSWNGAFKDEWSSNPAWVIYDLLINDRYGMGKYGVVDSQVDKWSFYRFAQHCDERVDTVIDGIKNDNSPYQERRYMCNLYMDTEHEAYSYIQKLLSIYSASLNFSGNQIYITYDSEVDQDQIVMKFNNSNIHEDGFSYSSTPVTSRISAVTIDYLDERDNYMRKSEYVEDVRYISEHGYSHIKVPGIAITRRGEAHRLGWRKILTQQLEREVVQFKSGMQASYLKVGDVIDIIDNNKNNKHYGGSILEVIDNRNIKIDIPTEVISSASSINLHYPKSQFPTWESKFYSIDDKVYDPINSLLYISTKDGNSSLSPSIDLDMWSLFELNQEPQFDSYSINSLNGFNVSLSSDISSGIKAGSSWSIAQSDASNSSSIKPFRVKSIKETDGLSFEIVAIEYIDEKYNFLDSVSSDSHSHAISDQSTPESPGGDNITFNS